MKLPHPPTPRRTAAVLCATALLFATSTVAAPRSELIDQHWTASGDQTLSHDVWDGFLQRHVISSDDGIDRVTYASVDAASRAELDDYLDQMQATVATALTRDEQFAFWVNLYNAATVAVVLDAYPVDSIRDIGGSLFSSGPWDDDVVTVEGRDLSLNDIEHGILRPIWQDPRIHYVVNCASIGCPTLGRNAMTATTKEMMLDTAARAYVNHPRGANVANGRLTVSSIYDWYAVDFGGSDANVIAHLRQFAEPDLQSALAEFRSIADDVYDWSLNEAK